MLKAAQTLCHWLAIKARCIWKRHWLGGENPVGQQPLVADRAREKQAENLYGAIHLGTGAETSTFCIDGKTRTPPSRGWS